MIRVKEEKRREEKKKEEERRSKREEERRSKREEERRSKREEERRRKKKEEERRKKKKEDQKEKKKEEERRRKKTKRESLTRKKIQAPEKVGKSRNIVFFPMICGCGGSKSRLVKTAGAELAGHMKDEKLHAVVAQSIFRSENVQNTPCSDHFWKLKSRKSARCCGAKHISKSKCTKHTRFGPLLEVEMSKKCTLLWREARLQLIRNTLDS